MKCVLVFFAILGLAVAQQYSSENDDLDIEAVVGDAESLKSFVECFNDKGSCNEQMADFKSKCYIQTYENFFVTVVSKRLYQNIVFPNIYF